jgi:hypothetical protein
MTFSTLATPIARQKFQKLQQYLTGIFFMASRRGRGMVGTRLSEK